MPFNLSAISFGFIEILSLHWYFIWGVIVIVVVVISPARLIKLFFFLVVIIIFLYSFLTVFVMFMTTLVMIRRLTYPGLFYFIFLSSRFLDCLPSSLIDPPKVTHDRHQRLLRIHVTDVVMKICLSQEKEGWKYIFDYGGCRTHNVKNIFKIRELRISLAWNVVAWSSFSFSLSPSITFLSIHFLDLMISMFIDLLKVTRDGHQRLFKIHVAFVFAKCYLYGDKKELNI